MKMKGEEALGILYKEGVNVYVNERGTSLGYIVMKKV